MEDSEFGLDCFSSSGLYETGGRDSSDIETKSTESPQPRGYSFDHGQDTIREKTSTLDLFHYDHLPGSNLFCSSLTGSDKCDQFCASQKLDKILGNAENNGGNTYMATVYYLLTLVCKAMDPTLSDQIQGSCPLANCTFLCNPQDGTLASHIPVCFSSKLSMYKCSNHNEEEEISMMSNQRSELQERTTSVVDAFSGSCRLNSEEYSKASGRSQKRRRRDSQDSSPVDNSAAAFAHTISQFPDQNQLPVVVDPNVSGELPYDRYPELSRHLVNIPEYKALNGINMQNAADLTNYPSNHCCGLPAHEEFLSQDNQMVPNILGTCYQYPPVVDEMGHVPSGPYAASSTGLITLSPEFKRPVEQEQTLKRCSPISGSRSPCGGLRIDTDVLPGQTVDLSNSMSFNKTQITSMAPPIQQGNYATHTSLNCHIETGPTQFVQPNSSAGTMTPSTGTFSEGQSSYTPSTAISSHGSFNFYSPAGNKNHQFTVPEAMIRWPTNSSGEMFHTPSEAPNNLGTCFDPLTNDSVYTEPSASTNSDMTIVPERTTGFPCRLCDKVFTQSSNLRRHYNEQHNSELEPYVCQLCRKSFRRRDNLKTHMTKTHAEGRN